MIFLYSYIVKSFAIYLVYFLNNSISKLVLLLHVFDIIPTHYYIYFIYYIYFKHFFITINSEFTFIILFNPWIDIFFILWLFLNYSKNNFILCSILLYILVESNYYKSLNNIYIFLIKFSTFLVNFDGWG